MRTFFILIIISLVSLFWNCNSDSKDYSAVEKRAIKQARDWLKLTDELNGKESWKSAALFFRQTLTENQWEIGLEAMKSRYGELLLREVKSVKRIDHMFGIGEGGYVVIEFDTSFQHQSQALEIVTMVLEEDETWRVTAYYLKRV